ncbi:MAG: DUF362 domain-containing protein, partial [Candidatus Hydrogenedentota bacterium]
MTRRISRRAFIRTGAMVPLAVASGDNVFADEPGQMSPRTVPSKSAVGARVAMVRARDGLEAVSRAIEIAGGFDFVQPGDSVLVKPAMNSSNPFPATTDPAVVALVVKSCARKGASRIVVADKPFFLKNASTVFERTGIGPAARGAGAEVVPLDRTTWSVTRQPNAENWGGEFRIPAIVSEFDHMIYLPTVRTHKIARFTMSLKNSVGLLAPLNCMMMHVSSSLPERIAEINLAVRPSFYILDGRRVFVEGGPDTGLGREPGVVFAGKDPVACDVVGLALLKTLGTREDIQRHSVWEQRMIKRAVEL